MSRLRTYQPGQGKDTSDETQHGSTANPRATPDRAALHALFDDSPQFVVVLDRDARLIYSNREAEGLPIGGKLGRLDSTNTAAQDLVRSAALNVFETGHAERFEMGDTGPAGPIHWFQCSATPIFTNGTVASVVVIGTDITTQKKLEHRLRRSESLMVDTQGTAHLGTWDWDITEPHAMWSEELYRIYGLTPETYTPSYESYLEMVHPDDRARVRTATDRVFQEHIPYSHDERIYRPDGSLRHLHTWAHPVLDESGKLVRLVGVCQDITERVHAEEERSASETRLRALFEGSPFGVALTDVDGHFLEANRALSQMLGVERDQLEGLSFADFALGPNRDADERDFPWENANAIGTAVEREIARADGEPIWVRVSSARFPAPGVGGDALAVMVEDITTRKRAEAADILASERLEKIHELEEVSEWKSQLLNIASHELKNPLTPIKIQLYLLRDGGLGELNPRQTKAVTTVAREVDRLATLVTDVLDVARIQTNHLMMRQQPTDAARLLADVVDSFDEAARKWGVNLIYDPPPPTPVLVDADRMKQVLFNLLGNALKFTPSGHAVHVRAAPDGNALRVDVEDEGPGLSPEQQSALFQPFSQVHEQGIAREKGTGLGLYISKAIVDAHHGRIWVDSEPGHGSTFHVTLPFGGAPHE